MDALLDAICNFAADDSKWDEGYLKTAMEKEAQGEGGGFQLDPRTLAMALAGAGGLAGGGALSGRLGGKQLALLAVLGAALGGGGHELYKYLQPDQGGEGGVVDGDGEGEGGSAFSPSLGGAVGTGLVGGGIGATSQLFQELSGRGRSSINAVLSAPTPDVAADRLATFLQRDSELQKRLGMGDPGSIDPGEIQQAARNLWQFGQAQGIDPNDPTSVRNAAEVLRSGTMDFDWEGDLPEEHRTGISRRQQLFEALADRARRGQVMQNPADPSRFSAAELDPDLDDYDRLRSQIQGELGEFDELSSRYGALDPDLDLNKVKARGRANLLTGEIPKLRVGDVDLGPSKIPTSFKAVNQVRNRLNRGIGFQARRIAPRMRGVLGGLGTGAVIGGLFGND